MTAKARKPPEGGTLSEYIERWENEGGAPECRNRSRKKRPRVANRPAKSMVDIETGEADEKGAVADNPAAVSLDRRGVHSASDSRKPRAVKRGAGCKRNQSSSVQGSGLPRRRQPQGGEPVVVPIIADDEANGIEAADVHAVAVRVEIRTPDPSFLE